jgi:hypothetical protein
MSDFVNAFYIQTDGTVLFEISVLYGFRMTRSVLCQKKMPKRQVFSLSSGGTGTIPNSKGQPSGYPPRMFPL